MRPWLRREDGSITVFILLIIPALLLVIGLTVDGGRRFSAAQQAEADASELARAAAQGVDPNAYLQGQIALNQYQVQQAAAGYLHALAAAGVTNVTGTVRITGANTITATVTVNQPTLFLSTLGFPSTVTGSASVVLDHGVLRPGG